MEAFMQSERKIATVFGASGFVGQHVVQRLVARGYIVRAAVRDTEFAKFLKPMGAVGQVVVLYAPITEEALAARAIEGAEIVINLAGTLKDSKKNGFFAVHADGAGRVARLARAAAARFVHISALGANAESPSAYARSKAQGEVAVRSAHPDAVILRPSLIFGAEDQFFNRFATLATYSKILPIVHGQTRFQPVYVGDIADAVIAALSPAAAGQVFELGGPEAKSFQALMAQMLQIIERKNIIWSMPPCLARLIACIPFSGITSDQLKLLAMDNVVSPAAKGLSALGIAPTRADLVLPAYLARYRVCGRGYNDRFKA